MPKPKPDDVMMEAELREKLAAAARRAPVPHCAECRRLRRAVRVILAEVRDLRATLTVPNRRADEVQGGHDDDTE